MASFRAPVIAALLIAATSAGAVVQVAGQPAPATGTTGEDGPANQAVLNNAEDIAVAPNGDIYIAEFNGARLLRIRDGILTVAYRGDFAVGENDFSGVAVAADGTVYFSTGLALMSLAADGTVTEILQSDNPGQVEGPKLSIGPDGEVLLAGGRVPTLEWVDGDGSTSLLAGDEQPATEPGIGDGGPAAAARFGSISDIAIDTQGVVYVADEGFGDVRRIAPDGVVSTVFGAGSIPVGEATDGTDAADIDYGSAEIGITVDDQDRLHVVPRLAGKVFRIEAGAITTVAGGGPNPGAGSEPLDTQLQAPFRIAFAGDDLLLLVEDGRFLFLAPDVNGGPALIASVPAPSEINLDPVVIAVSVALTAGLLFLVPFPAELFNNTLVEHHDRIRRWFRRRSPDAPSSFWSRPWVIVAGLVVMALLYGFLDPGFGTDQSSFPIFIGLFVGVVATTLGFVAPVWTMRRRRSGNKGAPRVLPVALIVAVACVLLSRLIGFLPGYLYGIALAVVFAAEVDEETESKEVLVTAGVVMMLAIGAWFGLGLARSGPPGVVSDIATASLAMITVAAFESLVFGLLPIYGMPGRILFRNRRSTWAVIWGVAVLAFFHVLVNPQSGYLVDAAVVPTATTYGLLAFFSIVSVSLWWWFRREGQRPTRAPEPTVEEQPG